MVVVELDVKILEGLVRVEDIVLDPLVAERLPDCDPVDA